MFDAVKDLAEVFPLTVFSNALSMKREGCHNLIPSIRSARKTNDPGAPRLRAAGRVLRALVT
jgi:hypothetical protein